MHHLIVCCHLNILQVVVRMWCAGCCHHYKGLLMVALVVLLTRKWSRWSVNTSYNDENKQEQGECFVMQSEEYTYFSEKAQRCLVGS